MDKKNKPSSYNFFKGEKYRKDSSNKGKVKRFWKWFKIFIYTFVFAVTLTGCVQSLAIPNSSNVGSGVEFYNSKDEISPNSSVFGKTESGYKISQLQNSVINGRTDDDKVFIKKLEALAIANGGTYGTYDTTSSLIILNNDPNEKDTREIEVITNSTTSNKILYFNSTFTKYEKQSNWTELVIPSLKIERPENWTGPFGANSIFKISGHDLSADLPIEAIFARDVLQILYERTIALEMYNNGKLTAAMDDVNALGVDATPANVELVNKFFEVTSAVQAATHFTLSAKNQTFDYNYIKVNPIAYASISTKPITSWAEAWELGPFFGLIWYPLAKVMGGIIYSLPSLAGWESIIAILIAIIATRLLTLLLTFKSIFAQSKQEELQLKKAKIDAKYAPYKGNKQMEQRQRQEVSEMYKKNNFNPMSVLGSALISMPIFLAMWRVVQGVAVIKSTTWLGINFSATSYRELLFEQMWVYLPLLLVTVIVQLGAHILPKILNRKKRKRLMNENEIAAMKKQQKTQNITIIIFTVFYLAWQAGIQIYSIFGGIWTIFQTLILHFYKKSKHFNQKLKPWLFKEKK